MPSLSFLCQLTKEEMEEDKKLQESIAAKSKWKAAFKAVRRKVGLLVFVFCILLSLSVAFSWKAKLKGKKLVSHPNLSKIWVCRFLFYKQEPERLPAAQQTVCTWLITVK